MAEMAAEDDTCMSCFQTTKYECIDCRLPLCNRCSIEEINESTPGWLARKRVGHCLACTEDRKRLARLAASSTSSTATDVPKKRTANNLNREGDKPEPKCLKETGYSDESSDESSENQGNNHQHMNDSSDDEFEDDEDEGVDDLGFLTKGLKSKNHLRKSRKKCNKKPGRKAKWSEALVNDLVDIVANDEYYKKKLIFTNTKNQKNGAIYAKILEEIKKRAAARSEPVPFTAVQLRTKFKKAVGQCKKAALTIKTATGISRFQEDNGYGQWFQQLFALVKTRDSCQPEQALEPSSKMSNSPDLDESESSSTSNTKLFVPVQRPNRKGKKIDPVLEVVGAVKNALENDPMKDLMRYMMEEAEKARQHELKLFQLLLQHQQPHPTYTAHPREPQPTVTSLATYPTPTQPQPTMTRLTTYPIPSEPRVPQPMSQANYAGPSWYTTSSQLQELEPFNPEANSGNHYL